MLHHQTVSCIAIGLTFASAATQAQEWQEGQTYQRGQLVRYQQKNYTATVNHTAYVGSGWNPAASSSLWQLARVGADPTSTQNPQTEQGTTSCAVAWDSGTIYLAGNTASYQGNIYKAKWWTRGEVPTASGQWGVWENLGACDTATASPTTKSTVTNTPTPTLTSSPTPTVMPTAKPTAAPTATPTIAPTPIATPTIKPTATPTVAPTATPIATPTATPKPTTTPTVTPTPSAMPTIAPTANPTATPAPTTTLWINEVASNPSGTGSWFEIYNPSASAMSLAGINARLRSNSGVITDFTLGNGTIEAGGYLVVAAATGALGQKNTSQIIYISNGTALPNWTSSGAIELTRTGKTLDFVRFGSNNDQPLSAIAWSGANAPSLPATYGEALVRFYAQQRNNNQASDWQVVGFSTPAGRNDVPANAVDEDGDGIPSTAKVAGGTYAGIDLYSMGARAGRPTILMQVDTMQSTDQGIKPQREALQAVQAAFARRGYDILFDTGNLYAASFSPADFNLGGGKQVAFAACVTLTPTGSCASVYDYKAGSMDLRRRQIFHYMLMGSSQNADGSSGSSGIAEIGGNDLLVSLGNWGLNTNSASNRYRLINYQAGTIMHELGHNLNLRHGGDSNTNYKPNYYSIMNYTYQLTGLGNSAKGIGAIQRYYYKRGFQGVTSSCNLEGGPCGADFRIDYSDGSGVALNEAALLEVNGIGRGVDAGIYADWNNSSSLNTSSYAYDLNNDGINNTLTDYNDWANVRLSFADYAQGSSGENVLRSAQAMRRKAPSTRSFMKERHEASEEHAPPAEFFSELRRINGHHE